MKTILLMLCVFGVRVGADDIRAEFNEFKSQLEGQYADLASRLSVTETKITELAAELKKDKTNRKQCERDGFTSGESGLCYYVSTEVKNWDESRQWCIDRNSDLMIIKSKEKQDLVASFNKRIWLGLTDKETEGVFQWVDGTPLTTPTYWQSGQPDWEGNDPANGLYPNAETDCVEYYNLGSGWSDVSCSLHQVHWMCERSMG